MARSFNGSSDIITIGTPSALNFTSTFTISVWANAVSFPALGLNYGVLFSKGYDGSKEQYVLRFAGANFAGANDGNVHLQAFSFDGGSILGIDYNITGNIVIGTAYQISFGWNGSSWFLYVNGVSVGTPTGSQGAPQNSTATIAIGGEDISGSPARFFNGKIADAAAWNVVLTATEIAALASGIRPYRIRRSSLVGYWPLEGTASPEPDVIGGNNGTLTGTSQAANPFNYTTPKYGSRLISSTGDRIKNLSISKNLNAAHTLSAWFKTPSSQAAAYGTVVAFGAASSISGIWLKSTNKMAYYIDGGGGHGLDPGNATLSASTWYHVALTSSGTGGGAGGGQAYLNGVADGTAFDTTSISSNVQTNIMAGSDISNEDLSSSALIADVCWWNVALTAAEVAKLAAGFRPHQVRLSGITLYWPLEGTASPEPDMTGSFDGTLVGTSAGASPTRYQDVVGA